MIDMHSHILPAVDDGAQTEQDSLDMARVAIENGISTIVATPHHMNRTYDNTKTDIESNVGILNQLFQAHNLDIEVIPGQEVRIYGEIIEDIEKGEILPINNSKYILVEFPSDTVPHYTEQLFYDMQVAGYTPIIAHPERNRELLNNHRKMFELVRNGALSQVTAGSLLGAFGKQMQQFSYQLIEANLTHLIASDAHNTTSRTFNLHEAYEAIKSKYGAETYYMFVENAHLLLDNMTLNKYEPQIIQPKRKFLGLF